MATTEANKSCLSREEQAEERQRVRFRSYWTELRAGSSQDEVTLPSFKLGDSRELADCSVLHLVAVFFLNMVGYWSRGFSGRHGQWGRVACATRDQVAGLLTALCCHKTPGMPILGKESGSGDASHMKVLIWHGEYMSLMYWSPKLLQASGLLNQLLNKNLHLISLVSVYSTSLSGYSSFLASACFVLTKGLSSLSVFRRDLALSYLLIRNPIKVTVCYSQDPTLQFL